MRVWRSGSPPSSPRAAECGLWWRTLFSRRFRRRAPGPTARQLEAVPMEALVAGGEALVEQILAAEGTSDATRRVLLGFPADRLADLADEESAELIVVGSRGRGPLK